MTTTQEKPKTSVKPPKGLGMAAAVKPHAWICKRLYDKLSDLTMKKTNKLCRENLDREAPVYRWGLDGEIIPDIAYFTIITKDEKSEPIYTDAIFEIEVVCNHGKKHSLDNIKEVLKNVKSMKEAFLYNYQTKKWMRYTPSDAPQFKGEESDYSNIFEVHLNSLLTK